MKQMRWFTIAVLLLATLVCTTGAAFGAQEDIHSTSGRAAVELEFTEEEQALIASLGTLRVGYIPDRIPLSYTNEATGEMTGISRRIFDLVSDKSGLRFEYVELPYGVLSYEQMMQRDIDIVTGVEYPDVDKISHGIMGSSIYLSSKKVVVARENFVYDAEAELTVAVATGSPTLKELIRECYPNFMVKNYPTTDDAFRALSEGKVDLLLQSQYMVNYYLSKPQNEQMKIVPLLGIDDGLRFGTLYATQGRDGRSEQESAVITSILNKTLMSISEENIERIVIEESTAHQYTYSFSDILYKYRIQISIGAVALIIVFGTLGYVICVQRKLHKRDRHAEEQQLLQQKRYQLVLDHMDDMTYEICFRGDSSLSSTRLREKFGWDIPKHVDEISNHRLAEIMHIHPEDEPQFRQSTERLVGGSEEELLLRIMRTDGKYLWCKVTRLPLIDNNGDLVSIVGKVEDVDSETRLHENLTLQSRTDSLTGLLQKQVFEQEVTDYLTRHSAKATCFIFIDMDYFKNVNDKLGHQMGDNALQDVARKLQVIFANYDLVSRFGGDEFCVFVKEIPRETLNNKLKWCQAKLVGVYTDGTQSVTTTASIGVAYCDYERTNYRTLFRIADEAVYEVKKNGRNGHVVLDVPNLC